VPINFSGSGVSWGGGGGGGGVGGWGVRGGGGGGGGGCYWVGLVEQTGKRKLEKTAKKLDKKEPCVRIFGRGQISVVTTISKKRKIVLRERGMVAKKRVTAREVRTEGKTNCDKGKGSERKSNMLAGKLISQQEKMCQLRRRGD